MVDMFGLWLDESILLSNQFRRCALPQSRRLSHTRLRVDDVLVC